MNSFWPRVRVALEPFTGLVRLAYVDAGYAAVGFEMRPLKDGECIPNLTLLDREEGQALMDQLWNCGLRPSEGSGSAGALAATQAHLADMRRIVFETRVPRQRTGTHGR